MLVKQILTAKPQAEILSVPPEATVAEAVEILSSRRIGALVVSTDGKTLTGILSERDVVRELGRRGAACLSDPVSALMTTRISSCAPDDTALDVLRRMTDGRFRHMPVLSNGEMVGFISIGDVVKGRLEQLAMENAALEGMIKGY